MEDLLKWPLPADWSVQQGRDQYLRENAWTLAAYDEPWTKASFLGIDFKVPNTAHHRWGIMLHDLHHVTTGYGTDLAGEGEVSAFELRRGLAGLGLYVGALVVAGLMAGLALAPRRTLRAWAAAGKRRGSLFQAKRPYSELLALSIGELRKQLQIPPQGLASERRGLHAHAPRPERELGHT